MNLTVGDMKAQVGKVTNLATTDSRIYDFINQAMEQLIWKGPYAKTTVRFAVTVNAGLIYWPREIETIESACIYGSPMVIRNGWYEFLPSGPGQMTETDGIGVQLIDRETSCIAKSFTGSQTVRLYTTVASDAAAVVILQGLDSSGNEIRMEYPPSSGTYIQGRAFTLTNPSAVASPETWSLIRDAIKPVTKGPISIRVWNGSVETPLATWDPQVTRPEYRISQITGVADIATTAQTLICRGKLRPYKVYTDNDWVVPANAAAIKNMCRAIWLAENEKFSEAQGYELYAQKKLEEQLGHYRGHPTEPINFNTDDTYAGCGSINVQ